MYRAFSQQRSEVKRATSGRKDGEELSSLGPGRWYSKANGSAAAWKWCALVSRKNAVCVCFVRERITEREARAGPQFERRYLLGPFGVHPAAQSTGAERWVR